MDLLLLAGAAVIALVVGAILGSVLAYRGQKSQVDTLKSQLESLTIELEKRQQALLEKQQQELQIQGELGQLRQQGARIPELQQDIEQWKGQWQSANTQVSELRTQLESQNARFEQEQKAFEDKLNLLKDSEARLKEQFENLANKIFEQKTEKFTESSKQGLDSLLTPLKEQIEGFKKQVSDQYVKEGQERASLKTEILSLKNLNQQMSEEASALTKALKGDSKQQGNWGEIVLERILSESGLREGHEYETQGHFRTEEGKAYKPDVIVHLPNEKDVVIDSKVSLTAYEQYFNQENEELRNTHLKDHITSLRNHIKLLGQKNYQDLPGLKTLDYVLMFVPVEPAFLLAIDQDPDLIKLALDNNIMLVSPTNLLVALRTINNIWQYEYQNQNAQDIAKKAADMYDKFVAFATDMEGLGASLQTVQKKYDGAMNKLASGRGNLVRRAEAFKSLGVQSSKQLSQKLLAEQGSDQGDQETE